MSTLSPDIGEKNKFHAVVESCSHPRLTVSLSLHLFCTPKSVTPSSFVVHWLFRIFFQTFRKKDTREIVERRKNERRGERSEADLVRCNAYTRNRPRRLQIVCDANHRRALRRAFQRDHWFEWKWQIEHTRFDLFRHGHYVTLSSARPSPVGFHLQTRHRWCHPSQCFHHVRQSKQRSSARWLQNV